MRYAGHQTAENLVVVPNYNYAQYLRERLTSIWAQTCPIFEVIVLDDASTDDSSAVLNELAQEMPEFRVVRNEQNGGSAIKQWARAVAEAKGDLLWIAEADDFADPKFLATVGSCFGDPEVVLAYSQSQQVGANGKMMARDYLGYVSDVDSELWRADYRRDGDTEIAEALSVKNTIPNVSAVLFRRTVLGDVLESLEERCAISATSPIGFATCECFSEEPSLFEPKRSIITVAMRQVLRFRQQTAATWTRSPPCSKLWSG